MHQTKLSITTKNMQNKAQTSVHCDKDPGLLFLQETDNQPHNYHLL